MRAVFGLWAALAVGVVGCSGDDGGDGEGGLQGDWFACGNGLCSQLDSYGFRLGSDGIYTELQAPGSSLEAEEAYCERTEPDRSGTWRFDSEAGTLTLTEMTGRGVTFVAVVDDDILSFQGAMWKRVEPNSLGQCRDEGESCARDAECQQGLCSQGICNGGDDDFGLPNCVPGQMRPCSCADGQSGTAVCLADGTFSVCTCVGPGGMGGAGMGGSPPPAGAGGFSGVGGAGTGGAPPGIDAGFRDGGGAGGGFGGGGGYVAGSGGGGFGGGGGYVAGSGGGGFGGGGGYVAGSAGSDEDAGM